MTRTLALAFLADVLTKWAALRCNLSHVWNMGEAHGFMSYDAQLLLTGAILVGLLWLASDARLTSARPWIGYVVGGGLANVASILTGPVGVLDFIPMGSVMVNVADLYIWAGLVGVIVTVARLAIREKYPKNIRNIPCV